jgi:hypothetical protein
MKNLLRVLFVLTPVLLFGSAACHATNFHVQVLDPNVCGSNPIAAGCLIFDSSAPIDVSLNQFSCVLGGVPNLPQGGDYGCAILVNLDPNDPITSLNVTFTGLGDLTFDCQTDVDGSIFAQSSCGSSGPGTDTFSFFNGSFPFLSEAVIYENGVSPDLFQNGTGALNQPPFVPTPEPDSLLLLSTGVLMLGGACFAKRRQHAFGRK